VKVTIDDVIEINERLSGYSGYEINFCNGMAGKDLDLDSAKSLASVIQEVMQGEKRKKFTYFKRD
jgi:hypothetical protein